MGTDPPDSANRAKRRVPFALRLRFSAVSWRDLAETLGPIVIISVVAMLVALHFVRPAPAHALTISSGPRSSTFESIAQQYRKILARNGIALKIVNSQGSLDNMNRLTDPSSAVDIALVQSGITPSSDTADTSHIVSLGSMFFEPLTIFYRATKPIQRLSELQGKRIAVGPEGSGTRALALLTANEIEPHGATQLLSLEGRAATGALLHDQLDAIFLTGDSASPVYIRELLHAGGIRLFDFSQADAYERRFPYLSKLLIPAGAFDLSENLPPAPVNMLAPTVELLAHDDLHPAQSDLLIDAATQVHGHASLLQYPISTEAARYYKSGNRSFAYRYLPFWLASLVNRAVVVLVPILVVVIPGLRLLPQRYSWRINSRIHRRYGGLALEREALGELTDQRRAALLDRLAEIGKSVISRRMPGSHANQLYVLREHIALAREYLSRAGLPGNTHAVSAE